MKSIIKSISRSRHQPLTNNMFNYIHKIKSVKEISDENMLVIPEYDHFYYELNELQKFKVIVDFRKFNYIENVNNYVYALTNITKTGTYFFGCFINNKDSKKLINRHKFFKFIETLLFILNSKTPHALSKIDIESPFNAHGFKIINMKKIHDITYFLAQKI